MAARYVIVGLRHQECQPIRMRWLGGQPHHLTKVAAARGSDFYDTYWLRTEDLADRWRSVARLLLRAGSIGPVRAWGTGGSRLPLTSHLGYGLRLNWCDCCSVSETLHSHLVDRGGACRHRGKIPQPGVVLRTVPPDGRPLGGRPGGLPGIRDRFGMADQEKL